MDTLYAEQIELILTRPRGIKALLFDTEATKQIVSNSVAYKKLLDSNYFYFDYLTNSKRSKININAVVMLSNTNLKLLINELVDPCYSSYTILFKNAIDPFALEILASADRNGVVAEVFELNMTAVKVDEYLYTVELEEFSAVLDTLDVQPSVYAMRTFDCSSFKNTTHDKPGKVLLLDRNFDLITPLISDWCYQGAISQYMPYNNSQVTVDKKSFALNDDFFQTNKFNDIEKVGENIRLLVKELEKKRYNISNYQFDDIEGATVQSKVVDTHMALFKKVLDASMRNHELGESEIKATKGESIDYSIFQDKSRDFMKLKLLESIKSGSRVDGMDKDTYEAFLKISNPIPFGYKPSFADKPELLAYESPIKRILRHFVRHKLHSGSFIKIESNSKDHNDKMHIIYVRGGLTYREYRDVMEQASELDTMVYLFTDKIINCATVMQEIESEAKQNKK
ncbi:VPS45 [Enterospora canceri]|uniref:VPS45 n=1 Tax=Enterospora canceri TaxID=1081671 RepID=A0A1Y1S904_9MICR|nr:VPS45 [Enterospora canceri]